MAEISRTEADLFDFIETAEIGLNWVGADGTILWANPADYRPLGYSQSEYVGHHIAEFHTDNLVITDLLGRLAAGERFHDHEAHPRCKDGSTRKVLITGSARFDDAGKLLHTRCFTNEMARVDQIERDLRISSERYHRAAGGQGG